ncbi:MAG: hypothetical protein O2816_10970 [Planctomycetota bacterium]|nr:hypothetical protein [Planctomycetota bacterium]
MSEPLPPPSRARLAGVAALVWLPYAWLVQRFWFVCDDAFISFRYARNWAQGHGPRYNLGEHVPVEGYSNFLWVALCALFERLGLDPVVWAPATSFLLGSLLLYAVLTILCRGLGVGLVPGALGALSLALFPPFAVWSSGGLETLAFAAAFLAVFERLIVRRTGPDPWLGGLAAMALSLIRVEGVGWALVLAVLGFGFRWRANGSGWRGLARYGAIVAVGFGSWWLWRRGFYESAVPNTVTAKSGASAQTLELGQAYVTAFGLAFLTPLALPLMVLGATGERRRTVLLGALLVFGVFLYAVLIGGDFMAMGRVLVPSFALLAVLLGALLDRLPGPRTRIPVAAGLITLALLPGFNRHIVGEDTLAQLHFRLNSEEARTEWEQWDYMRENTLERRVLGRALREHMPEGSSLVRGAIGVIGYDSNLFIHDTYGLVTREVAEREDLDETKSPGHQKKVELSWFRDLEPTLMIARLFVFEDGDVAALRRRLRRTVKQWDKYELEENYAPELVPLDSPAGERHLMLLYRRIEGDRPAAAWARWEQALSALE